MMSTPIIDKARQRLIRQILSARTLPEITQAQQALREWLKSHPEEQSMRDGFEQLAQMQEIAEMEEATRVQQATYVA